MDGLGGPVNTRDRERSRPPPSYPRAPSRSSTSSSATRTTHRSANSSSSRLASSPPPRPSTVVHPSHRFHHNSCKGPPTPRPQSTAPRAAPEAAGRVPEAGSHSAMSSFLQERLQRRREEAEKNAAARLAQDMSSSAEDTLQTGRSSPAKASSTDGRRPQSSAGSERSESSKKKGMGVKEMEATVSNLHKQNFDLKLELYHRRERQNNLEDRIDALEAQKSQMEEVNDELLEELEKRDKAVQEAVQMIVLLETQVEKLMEEREMVRQIEDSGYRFRDVDLSRNAPKPKTQATDFARLDDDVKTINRVPSFLSEKSESTANLRKVYLGTQGSVLSLPKVAEGGPNQEGCRTTSMAFRSPSLSELSESSFASVYGERDVTGRTSPGVDHSRTFNGSLPDRRNVARSNTTDLERVSQNGTATPSRGPRSNSVGRPGGTDFQSINTVVDGRSPVPKAQGSDRSLPPGTASPSADKTSRAIKLQAPGKSKDEKREALRKVTTDSNGRPQYDQRLPPTPDTISTSTLRRFKNSNDTLAPQQGTAGERSYLTLSDRSTSNPSIDRSEPGASAEYKGGVPVSVIPASDAAAEHGNLTHDQYFNGKAPLIRRPQSAGETTITHGKGNAWDSDEDSGDDRASVHSLESSLDIWLQQGKEPGRRSGKESPDLFGFPPPAGSWGSGAAQGPGASLHGEGASLHWPDPLDDLRPIQQALFGGPDVPPPPPNRRSSLHARTGSTSASASTTPQRPSESGDGKFRNVFRRRSRRNSDDSYRRPMTRSREQTPQRNAEAKAGGRSHYPPLSRPGTATPRASSGRFNNLWRRSLGGSGPAPSSTAGPAASEPKATDTATSTATGTNNNANSRTNSISMGIPSSAHRTKFDDDEARATPPPIQRQPRRPSVLDAEGAPVHDGERNTPGTPLAHEMPPNTTADDLLPSVESDFTGAAQDGGASLDDSAASGSTGGASNGVRRKWLPGFGKASSLRNRAG